MMTFAFNIALLCLCISFSEQFLLVNKKGNSGPDLCSNIRLLFKYDGSYSTHLCTVSLLNSLPLITKVNGVYTNIYPWVNVTDTSVETVFLQKQGPHMNALLAKSPEPTRPITFSYVCRFNTFYCVFNAYFGSKNIPKWVNASDIPKFTTGYELQVLKGNVEEIYTRWLGICRVLEKIDSSKNFNLTFVAHNSNRNILCSLSCYCPLKYVIRLGGPNSYKRIGLTSTFEGYTTFTVTDTVILPINLSLVRCIIESPAGWEIELHHPDPWSESTSLRETSRPQTEFPSVFDVVTYADQVRETRQYQTEFPSASDAVTQSDHIDIEFSSHQSHMNYMIPTGVFLCVAICVIFIIRRKIVNRVSILLARIRDRSQYFPHITASRNERSNFET